MVSVLTHGDLWTNNILWRKVPDSDGETFDEIIALIDWQVCDFMRNSLFFSGNFTALVCEISRKIFGGLGEDNRKENFRLHIPQKLCKAIESIFTVYPSFMFTRSCIDFIG